MRRLKDFLIKVIIIVALAVSIILCFSNKMEQIEDTNGPDDMSLAVITEADIIEYDMGSVGGPHTEVTRRKFLGITTTSKTTYYSKQFSGIYLLQSWNVFANSDLFFDLYDFEVTGGNFLMCVVHDDQIIATVEPTEKGDIRFLLEDVEDGEYYLYVVGESAAFEFKSNDFDSEV